MKMKKIKTFVAVISACICFVLPPSLLLAGNEPTKIPDHLKHEAEVCFTEGKQYFIWPATDEFQVGEGHGAPTVLIITINFAASPRGNHELFTVGIQMPVVDKESKKPSFQWTLTKGPVKFQELGSVMCLFAVSEKKLSGSGLATVFLFESEVSKQKERNNVAPKEMQRVPISNTLKIPVTVP